MHYLLDRLLETRKLKSKEELTSNELSQFENWSKILDGKLEVEDIAKSIKNEIRRLNDEWLAEDNKNPFNYLFHWKKDIEIKARLKNYNNLLKLIENKEKEKESLVKYIKNLINNKH